YPRADETHHDAGDDLLSEPHQPGTGIERFRFPLPVLVRRHRRFVSNPTPWSDNGLPVRGSFVTRDTPSRSRMECVSGRVVCIRRRRDRSEIVHRTGFPGLKIRVGFSIHRVEPSLGGLLSCRSPPKSPCGITSSPSVPSPFSARLRKSTVSAFMPHYRPVRPV